MTDAIADFERECEKAGVKPEAAVVAAGLHRATWFRWKNRENGISPTVRSLEQARNGIPKAKDLLRGARAA